MSLNQLISDATTAYKDTDPLEFILEFPTKKTVRVNNREGENDKESGRYVTLSYDRRIIAAFDELEDRRDELEELEDASTDAILLECL